MNLKDHILKCNDSFPTPVEVEGWGKVWIKNINVNERQEIIALAEKGIKDIAEFHIEVIKRTLCDEDGTLIFSDDADLLKSKSCRVIAQVAREGLKVNLLHREGVDEAKKDSPPTEISPPSTPSQSGSTDSPPKSAA